MSNCLRLKKSNCKNCYKCIRHCPVKSIRFSAGQAHIIGDDCILCGHCFVVCPQNAKEIVNDTEKVRVMLNSDAPVYASLAPSFIANYEGVGIESMRKALQQLGFADVEETAIGATMVKREYERMLKTEEHDLIISSCCHSVNLLIRKYYPSLLKYLADVVTPMHAHCKDIKRRHPEAKTVFIGPCVAKKDEAEESHGMIDAALTFEELTEWLKAENITLEKEIIPNDESRARFFPTVGGILKTMTLDAPGYQYMAVDGAENCITVLDDLMKNKKPPRCFIEMSMCAGSCVGGPVMEKYHKTPIRDYIAVSEYAGTKDFPVEQPEVVEMKHDYLQIKREKLVPMEYEITEILRDMGKFKPEDELNCGSCGYNTCREKAIAIFQGKADKFMCLPFLKEKAENFSDSIVKNTPNAVFVVNDQMEVQQVNSAAVRLVNLRGEGDILGENIVRVLDPLPFLKVQQTGKAIMNQREYLAEYDKYVEQTIVPVESGRSMLCLMHDVTEEEEERSRKEEISRQTAEVADQVVEKQMRIVQEIASLLGETAAETKVALTKLKEFVHEE